MRLKSIILFFIMLSSLVYSVAEGIYEAEDAILNGPVFANNHVGYSGTGFADYQSSAGEYIEWTVNADHAGQYFLHFRYALGSGNRPLEIRVNGVIVEDFLSFPSTGGWTSWNVTEYLSINLVEGNNILRATETGSAGANIDYLEITSIAEPSLEYRMDECYWLDNAGGVTGDIKDNSPSSLNGTSYASAQTIEVVGLPPICKVGTFNGTSDYLDTPDNVLLTTTNNYTVSTWLKPNAFINTFEVFVMKTTNYQDGFTLYIYWDGNDPNVGLVSLQTGDGMNWDNVSSTINASIWTHVTATYDGTTLRMYINGVEISTTIFSTTVANASVPLVTGVGLGGNLYYNGSMDELKIFDTTLSAEEISQLYDNENTGINYDGTMRTCNTCEATITASSWELVGIPIDLRTDPKTVTETFQGMTGTYGNDWRVYSRDYSDSNNSSWYTYLDDPDNNMTEFGKGYWLGNASSAEETWNVDDTQAVEYDSTHPDCPANQCVEIDVKSVSLDFTTDPNDGTGPYRYNLTGFVGKSPVSWADCRFIIDGTAYTPTAAESAGYASKVIWQYNPGVDANANGYTSCDDTTPGSCKLEPYKGFWVELREITKDKTVKLLVPKE